MSKNLSSLSARKGLANNLFDRIGRLAEEDGSPDRKDLEKLAREFLMGSSQVYGTSTFYDFTRPENRGKKVHCCNGSVCMVAGTQPGLKTQLLRYFDEAEIGEMTCLGRCYENGAFQYQGNNYSALKPSDWEVLMENGKISHRSEYAVQTHGRGVLTAPFPLEEAGKTVRNLLNLSSEEIQTAIEQSGLRGRGGAGFPIGVKMKLCRQAQGEEKFVVCNADEGDPGAFSDRYLLEERPYLVLTGMMVAGYAVGAQTGVLYIRAEYPESVAVIEKAIREMEKNGLAGEKVLDHAFAFRFKVIKARGSYVCGEETALIASIEGQRPEVRIRPPYPVEKGLFGQPTVVSNVETIACLSFLALEGADAFAALGTPQSKGTKLISLDSSFQKPGIVEVEMGTPLPVLIYEWGGGFRRPVKALHIGGPLGGIVPVQKIRDLTVDFESFSQNGFLLGHASVVGIPEDFPMIEYLEHLFAFTAHESCGKCFPCRLGSKRGEELLQKARKGNCCIDAALFDDLLDTLEKGSLCALGGGLPLPVRNGLRYFQDELAPFFG